MKVLVTGASGFVGMDLCGRLESQKQEVTRLDSHNCDLTKYDSLLAWNRNTYEQIYHLAAWTQPGDFCLYHPGEQWLINQQINTNVLQWWKEFQPRAKLIAIGTSCAYAPELEPIEENYLKGMPTESLFFYAMTKRMLYIGLLALAKQFGLRYLHVVPDTLYGPGYHTKGKQLHFIFDLMRKILRGKLYGEKVILWGDGSQRRELVYLSDFIDAMQLLAHNRDNDIVNIAPAEEFSIRYFAERICAIVGYDATQIEFDTTQYVGAVSKYLINKKLKRILPQAHFTPLDEGLRNTIDWFLANKETLL